MKKLFLLAAVAAFAVFSCTKEQNIEEPPVPQEEQEVIVEPAETVVITAKTETAETKTTLSEDSGVYHVLWAAGDQIKVNGYVETLATEGQPGGYGPGYDKAQFTGNNPIPNNVSPRYRAIYPSSATDQHFNFTLPAEQPYVAGGIAAFPMYAESDNLSFSFKNLCGIIQINLKGEKSVSSISLADKGSDPKPMSGRFNVVSDAAVPISGTNGTALICATPVALNTSDFTSFFITVPAATYGKLQIIVEASDGTICTLKSKNPVEVERSMITPISISNPTFKNETDQITYTTTNTTKPNVYAAGADASVFGDGLSVVSHTYDPDTKTGVITFSGTVTSIGYHAFRSNCGYIQTMTIPNTVTSIGERAFESCSNLVSLNFPRNLTTIGTAAFANCYNFVPDDFSHLTSFGESAFQYTKITGQLTLSSDLAYMGKNAFNNNDGITEVIIPHTPATMSTHIFNDCDYLTTVTFEESVAVPNNMFESCDRLTTVNFEAGATSIGQSSFNGCKALTSFTIPSEVTSIGQNAFANCGFTSMPEGWGRAGITYGSQPFVGCPITSITFPDHWTEVPSGFCREWKQLQTVNLGSGITAIRSMGFYYCSALTEITIPSQVNTIEYMAFGYTGLTSLPSGLNKAGVTFGTNVFSNTPLTSVDISNWTSVPENCFSSCKSLSSVTFGEGLVSILHHAFSNCTSLTSVSLPSSLNRIDQYAFASTGLTGLPVGLKNYATAGDHIFSKVPFTEITFPDACTSIPNAMFAECASLTTVHLNHVTNLDAYSFAYCSQLSTVNAPELETVAAYSFYRDYVLQTISLPAVRTLANEVFLEASNLKTVDIGTGIQSIGKDCFKSISDMRSLIIRRADAVPTLTTRLNENNPVPLIYVPAALVATYNATSPWSNYEAYIRPIGSGEEKGGSMDDYSNGGNL